VLAEVLIDYGSAMPDFGARQSLYRIAFGARQFCWAYYLVTNSPGATFEIVDKAAKDPLRFKPATDLNQPDAGDSIAVALAAQYPQLRRLCFETEQPVACSQRTRKKLQLTEDTEVVLEALANPAPRNYAAHRQADGGLGPAYLYQIVPYVTRLTSSSGG
jgi:hypothetical protein